MHIGVEATQCVTVMFGHGARSRAMSRQVMCGVPYQRDCQVVPSNKRRDSLEVKTRHTSLKWSYSTGWKDMILSRAMDHNTSVDRREGCRYKATASRYIVLGYFCINCVIVGCPLLNSGATMELWRRIHALSRECAAEPGSTLWCSAQLNSFKTALVIVQCVAFGVAFMGEAVVHTFSSTLCLLVSHLMYSYSAYLFTASLEKPAHWYYLACFFQACGGELLLKSLLPLAGLFYPQCHVIANILSCSHDLSILVYPVLLWSLSGTESPFQQTLHTFQHYQSLTLYVTLFLGLTSTIVVHVHRNAHIDASHSDMFATPHGNQHGHIALRCFLLVIIQCLDKDADAFEASLLLDADDPEIARPSSSLHSYDSISAKDWRDATPSFPWSCDLLGTKLNNSFFCILLFTVTLALLHCSFILNHHTLLFEHVGHNGVLSRVFMWLLPFYGLPHIMVAGLLKRWNSHSRLLLLIVLLACCTALLVAPSLLFQSLSLCVFLIAYSLLLPTAFKACFDHFGSSQFSSGTVVLGVMCSTLNFLSIPLHHSVHTLFKGNCLFILRTFLLLDVLCALCVLKHRYSTITCVPHVDTPCATPRDLTFHHKSYRYNASSRYTNAF